jgi:hypothetical protein
MAYNKDANIRRIDLGARMNDQRKRLRPEGHQLALGLTMGVSLAIIFAIALGSWTYALLGFVAGFLICSAVPLIRR